MSRIARIPREQRQQQRPPSGWATAARPFRAEPALQTLTAEGGSHLGWSERANHCQVTTPLRDVVQWHVDTGEVRLEPQTAASSPSSMLTRATVGVR